MRRPDDGGLEAEGLALGFGRVLELGGDDETAGNAAVVEILDVMQTARRAGASIGERGDDKIGFGGDCL